MDIRRKHYQGHDCCLCGMPPRRGDGVTSYGGVPLSSPDSHWAHAGHWSHLSYVGILSC